MFGGSLVATVYFLYGGYIRHHDIGQYLIIEYIGYTWAGAALTFLH